MGHIHIGLIRIKEEGWTGFSEGWQGCSEGFPEGEALPARIYILSKIGFLDALP